MRDPNIYNPLKVEACVFAKFSLPLSFSLLVSLSLFLKPFRRIHLYNLDGKSGLLREVQLKLLGYLARKKTSTPLGPPDDPRHTGVARN